MTFESPLIFRYIFTHDLASIQRLLSSSSLSHPHPDLESLYRGQTPLTFSVILGHHDLIPILMEAGASVMTPNAQGWTPFQESISFGNRETMALIYRKRRLEWSRWMDQEGWNLLRDIATTVGDFYAEFRWQVKASIPYLSGICPWDTYKVYKRDNHIRLDTSLIGFENMSWLRGNLSLILHLPCMTADGKAVLIDHDRRVVQTLWPRDFTLSEKDIEEEISISFNTPIKSVPVFDMSSLSVSRAQSGFWNFRYDLVEDIGPWKTQVWDLEGLEITTRVRSEHLAGLDETQGKKKKNRKKKDISQDMSRLTIVNPDLSSDDDSDDADTEDEKPVEMDEETRFQNYKYGYRNFPDAPPLPDLSSSQAAKNAFKHLSRFRDSLPPPPRVPMTLSEFLKADSGSDHLGRDIQESKETQTLSCRLWMREDGMTRSGTLGDTAWSLFLPLLSFMSLSDPMYLKTLKEFLNVQLPPGLPVQLQIPVLMGSLKGELTLVQFDRERNMETQVFEIPGKSVGYIEGIVL